MPGSQPFAQQVLNSPTEEDSSSTFPIRVDFDVEVDVVVDEVFAEEAKEFSGAVVAAVAGAIEIEEALSGEAPAVFARGNEDGKFQRVADPAKRKGAAEEMVWVTFGAGGEFFHGVGDELGGGVVLGVEEIGGAQVGEEHRVVTRVSEVFTGDAVHVDGEASGEELAFTQLNFTGGEAHGAAVVIEEIATGPADDALGDIEPEESIGHGRLREPAGAFERQAGCFPDGDPAFEDLDSGEAGGMEFFRRSGGIERTLPCPINDGGRGRVEPERSDVLEESRLVNTGISRTGNARGREDFRWQDVHKLRRLGREELGLKFAGVHRVRRNLRGTGNRGKEEGAGEQFAAEAQRNKKCVRLVDRAAPETGRFEQGEPERFERIAILRGPAERRMIPPAPAAFPKPG
jgi:hypothetical protein